MSDLVRHAEAKPMAASLTPELIRLSAPGRPRSAVHANVQTTIRGREHQRLVSPAIDGQVGLRKVESPGDEHEGKVGDGLIGIEAPDCPAHVRVSRRASVGSGTQRKQALGQYARSTAQVLIEGRERDDVRRDETRCADLQLALAEFADSVGIDEDLVDGCSLGQGARHAAELLVAIQEDQPLR